VSIAQLRDDEPESENRTPRQHSGSSPNQLAYGIEDASRLLGLGRSTTFAEISAGRLKSFRVGKRRLVPASALSEYVADRMAEGSQ
jgi:excisionase family DNA binding protein